MKACAMRDSSAPAPVSRLDRLGFALSGLCLIHCLLLPIIIAILPVMSSIIPEHEVVHFVMIAMAIPISGTAIFKGYLHHRVAAIPLIGAAGLLFLLIGALLGGAFDVPVTVTGSLLLATAHLRNWRHMH
jgi:hypothetical protein